MYCAFRVFTLIILSRFLVSGIVPLPGTLWKTSRGFSGFAAVFLESWAKIEHLDIQHPRDVQDLFRHTADHSFVVSWAVTPHCVTVHPGIPPVDGKQRFWQAYLVASQLFCGCLQAAIV